MRTHERKRILVTIPSTYASCREIIKGLGCYCRRKDDWEVTLTQAERLSVGDLRQSIENEPRIDGVIDNESHLPELVEAFAGTDIPIVVIGSPKSGSYPAARNIVFVELDNRAVGAFAAQYLAELGNFASYAFISAQTEASWSLIRHDGYVDFFRKRGTPVMEHQSGQGAAALEAFIANLPKPAAIMCAWDSLAVEAVNACRQVGVNVPRQATIIGVDNDETICEFVSLISVDQGAHRLGYQAAATLDRMMSGRRVSCRRHYVEPEQIVVRRSSDVLAIEDRDIANAVRYIHDHGCDGIRVQEVVQAVGLSRSTLERKFCQLLGCTLHDEIRRIRLARAEQLLREGELTLRQIANRTAFRHLSYFNRFFRQATGQTPAAWRRAAR